MSVVNRLEPIFEQIEVGMLQNFAYIIGCPQTRVAAVVDPGLDPGLVIEKAKQLGLRIGYVINTHTHPDHAQGNKRVQGETGAKIVMHILEPGSEDADILVEDGDTIDVGNIEVKVLHTPGHTPGSICLLVGNKLLTGDTLFVGDCGRTDLIGGDPKALYHSLKKIRGLDDGLIIYPGHNYGGKKFSTLGEEKKVNPCLGDMDETSFIRFMDE